MQTRTRLPSTEHQAFDHLCERLEDFEPLPAAFGSALERPWPPGQGEDARPHDDDDSPLDGQILAGLVTPV